MNKILETLCDKWLENEIKASPEFERVIEKYSNDSEVYADIGNAVAEEQKLAFNAGFRTAVQLLMGGMQS